MASSMSGDGRTRLRLPRRLGNPRRRRRRSPEEASATAAASYCAVERPRGMGLGARVAGCCLLGPYGGGGGYCWATAGPAKILGSRVVEAAGLPLKCAQL